MKRHNGSTYGNPRFVRPRPAGRHRSGTRDTRCRECGVVVYSDLRPYCVEHSPYAQRVIREWEAQQ